MNEMLGTKTDERRFKPCTNPECHTPDAIIHAKGLCEVCYSREHKRRKYGHLPWGERFPRMEVTGR